MKTTLIVLSLLVCSLPAFAQEFLASCSDKVQDKENKTPLEYMTSSYCIGYVSGFIEAAAIDATVNVHTPLFCLPEGSTNFQFMRVINRYINNHPERGHYELSVLVNLALTEAFPCKPKK
jgi:hypothetical protein